MSGLPEFLNDKRQSIEARRNKLEKQAEVQPQRLSAAVRVAGRSGVREIRIRDYQVISDSPPDFAGYDLGPSSPELQLGVLGSCVSHVTLIQAAQLGIPLDRVDVEVAGHMHPLAGRPGYEDVPVYLHDISYTLRIASPASEEQLAGLHEAVERACPILNLLLKPQTISGRLERA